MLSFLEKTLIFGKGVAVQFLDLRRLSLALITVGLLCLVLRQKPTEAETVSRAREVVAVRGVILSAEEFTVATAEELRTQAIDLRGAQEFFAERQTFRDFVDDEGRLRQFRAGCILVQWRDEPEVSALATKPGQEMEAREFLAMRDEVAFAELDMVAERQSLEMNDPRATNQWHHAIIGTTNAWRAHAGSKTIRIGMIDDAFQMDHPDLVGNVVPGWDVDRQQSVAVAAGHYHSTMGAGLATAVAGNNIGIAGVSQCAILPITGTNYTTTFFYNAILWAADNGVRVVNASWDLSSSATINAAGQYLRDHIQGILIVSGENPRRSYSYPNHPYIFTVSMTDQMDDDLSGYGSFVDLAAPGWNIYSTTVNSSYDHDTGTSYSAPIVAGVAAALLSINPSLTTDQLIAMLKFTADDLGPPGYDVFYGWGRLNYRMAALGAFATLPVSRVKTPGPGIVTVPLHPGALLGLGRATEVTGPWSVIPSLVTTNENVVQFEDTEASAGAFYRVEVTLPP